MVLQTPPLYGFPEESLIHCWFGLLLLIVSVSKQCVETGYLPGSAGERIWAGSRRAGLEEHHATSQPTLLSPPTICLSHSLSLYPFSLAHSHTHFSLLFLGQSLFSLFSLSVYPSSLSLPPTPILSSLSLCLPPFLSPPHNAYLWKEVALFSSFFFRLFSPLVSFESYKGTEDLSMVIISCRE